MIFSFLPLLLWMSPAAAQHVRLGVIGGTAITDDYATYYSPAQRIVLPDGTTVNILPYSVTPESRSPIGGPAIAWDFNNQFSVETNAIYRRLRVKQMGPTVTWEFPVLLKFRLPSRVVRPFVELGPSLRTTGNRNTSPSHTGVTAGAGVDWQWQGFRFAPTLRYTRWTADNRLENVRSKQDQLEVLLAVSRGGSSDRDPLGKRVRLGVTAGATLLRPLRNGSFGSIGEVNSFQSEREYERTWIIGPRLEVNIKENLRIIGEANFRQVLFRETTRFDFVDQNGIRRQGIGAFDGKAAVLWQFPVLLRYQFGWRGLRPFVDAGPSFRLPQEIGAKLAVAGVSGAAGLRFSRFEGGLRFTHWGKANFRNGEVAPNEVRRNQLDAMFAVSF